MVKYYGEESENLAKGIAIIKKIGKKDRDKNAKKFDKKMSKLKKKGGK